MKAKIFHPQTEAGTVVGQGSNKKVEGNGYLRKQKTLPNMLASLK